MKRLPLALAGVAVLAACSASPSAPAERAPSAPPGHLLVGAADTSYQAFATSTGVRPAVVEHYIYLGDRLPTAFAGSAEPLVQVEPHRVPLQSVAAGKYDAQLRQLAGQAKSYGKPLVLGWAAEMNGPWYSWGYTHVTPAQYIAAWRHVVSVFRQAGASNVTWLWTVNAETPGVSGAAQWWPGAQYVGEVGIDGYLDTAAETYAGKIAPTAGGIRRFWSGPVILSETSVAQSAGQAAKIPGLFAGAAADHLAGVIWFNLPGNKAWPIKGPAALAAFRAAAKAYG